MKKFKLLALFILALAVMSACGKDDTKKEETLGKGVDEKYVGTYQLGAMGQATGDEFKNYLSVPLSEDISYMETIQLHKNGLFDHHISFYDDAKMKEPYQKILQRYHYENDGNVVKVNQSLNKKGSYYHIRAYKNEDGSLKMSFDGLKQLQDYGAKQLSTNESYELYDASAWYKQNQKAAQHNKEKLFFNEEGMLVSVVYSKADDTTSVLIYEKKK